jgi:dihydroorotate dehydrogenase
VGISVGKSKVTPLEEAVEDYVASLAVLYPYGDYFAVNVSSPNTPGLRTLQDRDHLDVLLAALRAVGSKPLLVKVAPDLSDAALGEVVEVCEKNEVSGLIATNTTLSRDGRNGIAPADAAAAAETGGLSGAPLTARAREVVRFVVRETAGRLPVVGVGGIMHPDDALRLRDAGASLVQMYTGLIYGGPALVRGAVRAFSSGKVEHG